MNVGLGIRVGVVELERRRCGWSGVWQVMDCMWEDEEFGVKNDHRGFDFGPPDAGPILSWWGLEEDVLFIER